MLSEKRFLKVSDSNPLSFPKMAKPKNSFKALAVIIYLILFTIGTLRIFSDGEKVREVRDVLKKAIEINAMSVMPINLYCIMSPEYDTVSYSDLENFDSVYGFKATSETIFLSFVLCHMSQIVYVVLRSLTSFNPLFFTFALLGLYNLGKLSALKKMTQRRLQMSLDRASTSADMLKFLPAVRRMLDFNRRLNRIYSVQAAIHLVGGLESLMLSVTGFWDAYGIQVPRQNPERITPIFALFCQDQVVISLLLLGYATARISNTVKYCLEKFGGIT